MGAERQIIWDLLGAAALGRTGATAECWAEESTDICVHISTLAAVLSTDKRRRWKNK